MGTGSTSSITSAAYTRRFAIPKYSHGFVLIEPNSEPVNPAIVPRAAYTSARPITYEKVSPAAVKRDAGAPLIVLPPTMAAVIGIIGYTQGVRLVSTPAANRSGMASIGLE